ncbi:phytanoyl-CoA dioxygenase family protein [Pseudokordiimonas caeni]|uniref:phytanoyl-CoA dioxygenase family protein n=1 Tax=Pseudokordiimonas caeni TaxID=2997908 RepID=UPI0028114789|nr:phytanoyl-CoA dioxygenase family protein [Pseudokordiimonas caeni]
MLREETVSYTEEALKPWLQGRSLTSWFDQYDEEGYVIFPRVMPSEGVTRVREALQPYLEDNKAGRNDFEGLKSNRVYALLAKSPVFVEMATHPLALAFAEHDLGRSCLLSACLAIKLHPGETVQPWHYDDSHIDAPMPRPTYGTSTFWAIDDTTETNGATEIIPRSHKWGSVEIAGANKPESFTDRRVRDVSDDPGARADAIKAVMPSGSFMVAKGTLWHRGGANRSDAPRLIVTPQYVIGWARTLENMSLAVPRELAKTMPGRAQELLGYSIHPPFMGYVDGVHPKKVLG